MRVVQSTSLVQSLQLYTPKNFSTSTTLYMWFGFPLEASLVRLGAWLPTEIFWDFKTFLPELVTPPFFLPGWPALLATIWWKMLDQDVKLMKVKHLILRCCEVKCSNHYGAATDGPSSTKANYGRPQQGKAYWAMQPRHHQTIRLVSLCRDWEGMPISCTQW